MATGCIVSTLPISTPIGLACANIGGYTGRFWVGNRNAIAPEVTIGGTNEAWISAIGGEDLLRLATVSVGSINTTSTLIDQSGTPIYDQAVNIRVKSKGLVAQKFINELAQAEGLFIVLERYFTEEDAQATSDTIFFESYGLDNGGLNCRVQDGGAAVNTVGANKGDQADTMLTFTGKSIVPFYAIKSAATSTRVDDLAVITAVEYLSTP